MVWFKVDDGLCHHQKAMRAGLAAMGMWTLAGSWSALNLEDGFVPAEYVRQWRGERHAQRLVDAGLWVEAEGGWQFHQWNERNPTREEVLELREKREAAGRSGGLAKAKASATAKRKQNPSGDEPKSYPVPVPEPVPQTKAASSGDAVGVDKIVAAWVEGAQEHAGERPANRLVAQVGRQARELVAEGKDPRRLVAAAHSCGLKGYADLGRELLTPGTNGHTQAEDVLDRVQAQLDARRLG